MTSLFLAALIAFLHSWRNIGVVLFQPELPDLVKWSDTIAVVRITGRHPVRYRYGEREYECGFVYEGSTREILKGTEGTLRFFGADAHDYIAEESEYFVATFPRGPDVETLAEGFSAEHRARLLCEFQAAPRFVRDSPQTLIAFDSAASRAYSGRWLRPERFSIASYASARQLQVDARVVYEWGAVRREVLTALELAGKKLPSNGALDPVNHPDFAGASIR